MPHNIRKMWPKQRHMRLQSKESQHFHKFWWSQHPLNQWDLQDHFQWWARKPQIPVRHNRAPKVKIYYLNTIKLAYFKEIKSFRNSNSVLNLLTKTRKFVRKSINWTVFPRHPSTILMLFCSWSCSYQYTEALLYVIQLCSFNNKLFCSFFLILSFNIN